MDAAECSVNVRLEQILKWSPPMVGHLKLNVDAAFKGGRVALAMIMRDHKGCLIFLQSLLTTAKSAYHPETLALD